MYKLLLFLGLAVFVSCKDNKTPTKQQGVTNSDPIAKDSFTTDEMDLIDGCVENAQASIGEEKAFILCKCILLQVKKDNPNLDSATLARTISDTAKVGQLAKNCK